MWFTMIVPEKHVFHYIYFLLQAEDSGEGIAQISLSYDKD